MTKRALFLLLLFSTGCAMPPDRGKDSHSPYFSHESRPEVKGFQGVPQLDDSGKEYRPIIVTNEEFKEGGLALAGFVVRDSIKIHRTFDLPPEDSPFDHFIQNETFGPTFEQIYRDKIREPVLVPFWEFDDKIPDELLEEVWFTFARDGTLPPELLEEIRATDPGVRFISLALIYLDDLTYHVTVSGLTGLYQSGVKSNAGNISKVPNDPRDATGVTRQRNTAFMMALFDLETVILVWSGGVHVELHEESNLVALDNIGGFVAKDLGDGEYTFEEVEDLSGVPTFSEALEKGMKKLISEMEKAAGGLPNPSSTPREPALPVDLDEEMF